MNLSVQKRPETPQPAAGTAPIAVRIDGVSKRFGTVTALESASLDIAEGEFMTLLGPSGCGKTTLLNLVAGFLEPDGGDIHLGSARITDVPPYRRHVGMVFQNYALFPHMDVARNVAYGLKMRKVPGNEIAHRVAEALEIVKLSGMEDRRPRQLSGGQQQRVALARAIVISPRVLLLDEPLSALDRNLRASMQIELKEIQRRLGITTIFVTHDQGEALSLSDRIAVMSDGEIQQTAPPEEIYRRPATPFVASFVGDINRFAGRLERVEGAEAVIALADGRMTVPAEHVSRASGTTFDVFVRPEHLTVAETPDQGAITGTVARHVYQGSHVDMYVDSPAAEDGRMLIRVPEHDAPSRWPAGSGIGLAIRPGEALLFPRKG